MKRVLITRSPHQASELAERLRALGAEPILVPTIELAEPSSFAALDAAMAELESFDWLLFTSANAVEAVRRRVPQALPRPGFKIAVIGSATARALEAFGVKPDLMPAQAVAEEFAEALLPYAKRPDGSSARFLLVRAEEAREYLPDALRAAGAEVTIAPAYRNVVPAGSTMQLQELFARPERWPDAITFTSSSTAQNLFTLLQSAGLSLPAEILRASIGPITSQTLRDLGCPPHLEAAEARISALVEILVKPLGLEKFCKPLHRKQIDDKKSLPDCLDQSAIIEQKAK